MAPGRCYLDRAASVYQGEGKAASGGVDHLRGSFDADAQATGLGDALHQPVQDLDGLKDRGGRGPGPGVSVH